MHLLIFGASGRTGLEIISQALSRGYEVTAFVRDPAKLDRPPHQRLFVIKGDVLDPVDVELACKGKYHAVICSLGGGLKDQDTRTVGTRHIVEAMKRHLPSARLWVVSSVGVGDSRSQATIFSRMTIDTVLHRVFQDHEGQEAVVRESGLPYSIVRPTGLTDGCRSDDYEVKMSGTLRSHTIKRADVADFILANLDNPVYLGQAVSITG